jgi:hypothetical protein
MTQTTPIDENWLALEEEEEEEEMDRCHVVARDLGVRLWEQLSILPAESLAPAPERANQG